MKVGIKLGPKQFPVNLERSGAKYAEVYFRLDQKDLYKDMFRYMRKNEIQFGLHFWALIKGKYMPNLAYCRDGVDEETEKLIKETIDIASQNGACYVNFHPESLRNLELNLDKQEFRLADTGNISEEEAFGSLKKHLKTLRAYADERNVKIYIETVPLYCPSHFRENDKQGGRMNPVESLGVSTAILIKLGRMGYDICFDIAHDGGQYPGKSTEEIFQNVLRDAKEIAPYTKLVHVNTTTPPFNGTDSHNGILKEDFEQGIFPNKEQLLTIFDVFKKYPKIWYIPEPQIDKMVENYFELKKIIEK